MHLRRSPNEQLWRQSDGDGREDLQSFRQKGIITTKAVSHMRLHPKALSRLYTGFVQPILRHGIHVLHASSVRRLSDVEASTLTMLFGFKGRLRHRSISTYCGLILIEDWHKGMAAHMKKRLADVAHIMPAAGDLRDRIPDICCKGLAQRTSRTRPTRLSTERCTTRWTGSRVTRGTD